MSAPGVLITIPGLTNTDPDTGIDIRTGTSFAAPHAAAMAANFLERFPIATRQAALIRAQIIAGAKRPVTGGEDHVGVGGVDYFQFVNGVSSHYINGNNGDFDQVQTADGADDGWVTRYVDLLSSHTNARIVLAWQADGSYISDDPTDHHQYGANYDFRVFDPNGGYLGGGFEANDDQYEIFSFNPAVTGSYRIEYRRLSNADADMKTDVAWSINYQ